MTKYSMWFKYLPNAKAKCIYSPNPLMDGF